MRHYKPFCKITFTHQYYSVGICTDFALYATPDTLSTLKGLRMMWGTKNRQAPSNHEILREYVDSTTPVIDLPSKVVLRFGVRLTNEFLQNVTDIPALGRGQVYLFTNSGSLAALNMEVIDLFSGVAQINGLNSGDVVSVTYPDGSVGLPVTAQPDGAGFIARFDLVGKPVGIYTFTWGPNSRRAYLDPGLVGEGLYGIVHLEQGGGKVIQPAHTYGFAVRSVKWNFFVKLSGDHSNYSYLLDWPGMIIDGYAFTAANLPPNYGTQLRALCGPGETLIGFTSRNAVAYSDVVLSSIALKRDLASPTGSPKTVLPHLPNPAPGSAAAAVVVSLGPPVPL